MALTISAAVVAIYLGLASREPAMVLQPLLYGFLFVSMVSYLQRAQVRTNDRRLLKEKLAEELHLASEEIVKKKHWKRALEKKIDRFMDLSRFSEELKVLPSLEDVSKKVTTELLEALDTADQCVLYLVEEGAPRLSLVSGSRRPAGIVKEKEGSVYDRWVMKRAQGLLVDDAANDYRFSSDARAGLEELRSVCASPLVSENKVLGILRAASSDARAFTSDDLRLLDTFASVSAVTIRNILLYRRMAELAIRDSLTGLYVNRYFQGRLSEEVLRAGVKASPFSLILMDIDHFKRYNDEFGHAAGDIVLKQIASVLAAALEPSDLLARYGGEEFVVLLPGKTAREALAIAGRMREAIAAARFSIRRVEARVTASFGVAAFPQSGKTKEELLLKVDKNLYEAKRSGRNRVCGDS